MSTQTDAHDGVGSRWATAGPGGHLRARESAENFPVALRVLPARLRTHLRAVYGVTRVIDDLGDEAPGDRVAALAAFADELDAVWAGQVPDDPVLRPFAATVVACGLSRQPFADLTEANVRDQTTTVYPTYADLAAYCALSANPVGRIVLEVFGVSTPARIELSDRVCTALQIIEHCQDVAEDRRAGRVYLPLEDLHRFGVSVRDLDAERPPAAVARLIAFEAARALALLESGRPLLRELHGWARLAVAGYLAGGRAAVAALARGGWSVRPAPPPVRRVDVLAQLAALWFGALLPDPFRPAWRGAPSRLGGQVR